MARREGRSAGMLLRAALLRPVLLAGLALAGAARAQSALDGFTPETLQALAPAAIQQAGGAPGTTLEDYCRTFDDDPITRILFEPFCEGPGGPLMAARNGAAYADLPELGAAAVDGGAGQVLLPAPDAAGAHNKTAGEICGVEVDLLQIIRTDRLHLETAPADRVQAASNQVVQTKLENILASFNAGTLGGGAPPAGEAPEDGSQLGATYSIRSLTDNSCGPGLQCEISISLIELLVEKINQDFPDAPIDRYGLLPGQCAACPSGSFCPPGSVNDEEGMILGTSTYNLCPEGFFCESTTSIKACPQGYFCPAGSISIYNCNGLNFNTNETESANIDASLSGNYCPVSAATPMGDCPPGYYCPNATALFLCPPDHYCPRQSLEPTPCPLLSSCGAGRSKPQVSWIALIGLAVIFVALVAIALLFKWSLDRKKQRVEARSLVGTRQMEVVGKLCKLTLPRIDPTVICNDAAIQGFVSTLSKNTVHLKVRDLNIAMKEKVILDRVSVDLYPGTLNAVFGPSGAGKTTLIRSICGKLAHGLKLDGEVEFLNGTEAPVNIYRRKSVKAARRTAIRLGVGYVPQDSIVHESLTVYENVYYSAKLRLAVADEDKTKIVRDTIQILGLGRIQHSLVGHPDTGGISGGECRRVSIGLELAACPPILILDEPTTGLDAVSANDVVAALQRMSRLGLTIAASLHQPRFAIFQLFDNVHILKKGGKVVYTGSKEACLPYFKALGFRSNPHENPADFLIDVASGMIDRKGHPTFTPEDLVGLWRDQYDVVNEASILQALWRENMDALSPRSDGSRGSGASSPRGVGGGLFSPRRARSPRASEDGSPHDPTYPSPRSRSYSPRHTKYNVICGRINTLYFKNVYAKQVAEQQEVKKLASLPSSTHSSFELDGSVDLIRVASHELKPGPPEPQAPGSPEPAPAAADRGFLSPRAPTSGFEVGWDMREDQDPEDFSHSYAPVAARYYLEAEGYAVPLGEVEAALEQICKGAWRQGLKKDLEVCQEQMMSNITDWVARADDDSQKEILALVAAAETAAAADEGAPAAADGPRGPQKVARSGDLNPASCASCNTWGKQFAQLLRRDAILWFREISVKAIDMVTIIVCAVILGFTAQGGSGITDINGIITMSMLTSLFMGMLSVVWAMDFINAQRNNSNREAGGGTASLLIYSAKVLQNTAVDVFLRPIIFCIVYYNIALPRAHFGDFFLVMYGTAISCSGLGYLIAVLVPPAMSTVIGLIITFTFGGILNGFSPYLNELPSPWVAFPSYARWAVEALSIREFREYNDWKIDYGMSTIGYTYSNWPWCLVWLYVSGLLFRVLAFPFYRRICLV